MTIEHLPVDEIIQKIRLLSSEIGPRPAGSAAESRTQKQLSDFLVDHGFSAQEEPFIFPSQNGFFPYIALIGIWLILGALIPRFGLILLIISPFVTGGLPELYEFLNGAFSPKRNSQNVLLTPTTTAVDELDILFVAHCDSARIQPIPRGVLRVIFNNLMPILEVICWFLTLCSIAILVGPMPQPGFEVFIRWFAVILGVLLSISDVWQQLSAREQYSPGANDNASGAAICTTLLENLDQIIPKPPKVGFLMTGAEEAGLYGSRSAVKLLQENGSQPIIVNVDMVGQGKWLGSVSRAGRLMPGNCDQTILEHLKQYDPNLYLLDYKYRSGDLVPFLKAGYRVISLEMTNNGKIPPNYHSAKDDVDQIDPRSIGIAADTLIYLMRTFPEYRSIS